MLKLVTMKKSIQIYLVGGAVRDELLGLPIKERDYVVVGATPEYMHAQGFRQVGRDFPVFLHPKTHEEYALARTERKTGKGYRGFVCHAEPSVTLEEDLQRRDLTINAIAKTTDGRLIDPYGGVADLKHKILRHVSASFIEDPVRILRVARFAARFGNFKVHHSTNKLMQNMLFAGEVDALVPERVWQEFERALGENYPYRFFEVLNNCGVLQHLFPGLTQHLSSIKLVLKKAVRKRANNILRFAAIFKNATAAEVIEFCKQYRVPNNYKEFALIFVKYYSVFMRAKDLSAVELLNFLEHTDAFRRPERFLDFLQVCAIVTKNSVTAQIRYLKKAYNLASRIQVAKIANSVEKNQVKIAIRNARLNKLKEQIE